MKTYMNKDFLGGGRKRGSKSVRQNTELGISNGIHNTKQSNGTL